jgi:putative DNA primase/helicase
MKHKRESYLDIKVGVYVKSVKGFRRTAALPLRDVLTRESYNTAVELYRASKTDDTPKGDSDLKKNIKAFQPSGDYGQQSRSAKNTLATATNLVQLDFDCKIQTKRIKDLFNKYKWIAVAARSCGGQGFYLLVHVETSAEYGQYFAALCSFFTKEEKLEVDKAVGSINEIRFVSLTSEVLMREDATVWSRKETPVVSTMERVLVPLDGKLIDLPEDLLDESGAHYYDIISWAGKQNINGVPLEVALGGFPTARISPKSSFYNKLKNVQAAIINVYERYAEQHGVASVSDTMLSGADDLGLPELSFDKKNSREKNAQMIVDAVCMKYQFKTDYRLMKTYRFVGTHWIEVLEHSIEEFLCAAAVSMRFDSSVARFPAFKQLMHEDLQSRTRCTFDLPERAFNVKNGIIFFNDGEIELREHSDSFNFTYVLDYEYDPKQKVAPLFDAFMKKVLPIPETHKVFYQYIGAAFLPKRISFEKTLIIFGSGANGKSTLMNLLESLFGDAVGTFNLTRLTNSQSNENAKEALQIYGKTFGICRESNGIKDTTIFKSLASKEKIPIKYLFKDDLVSDNYGRLITCMNNSPKIESVTGTMRRVIILGMTVQIPESEQDRSLAHKLTFERSAILNHIIQGYKEIYASGGVIFEDESTKALTQEIIDDQNLVLNFLKDRKYFPIDRLDKSNRERDVVYDEHVKATYKTTRDLPYEYEYDFISDSTLKKEYREWLKEEGYDFNISKAKFVEQLREIKAASLNLEFKTALRFNYLHTSNGTKEFIMGWFKTKSTGEPAKPKGRHQPAHRPDKKSPF